MLGVAVVEPRHELELPVQFREDKTVLLVKMVAMSTKKQPEMNLKEIKL